MELKDIHSRFYSTIPEDVFWRIVRTDPTYDGRRPQKRGKYTQWLLHSYKKGVITTESLDDCATLLGAFHRFRHLLEDKDILRYGTLQRLRDVLDPYLNDPNASAHETSKSMRIRKIKEGAEKVYEDDQWAVFVPHTWEASCYYGKGTRWCTAFDATDRFFNSYNEIGPLYININRQTKQKWQFHFETQTFCNAGDESVSLDDVPLTESLRQFYELGRNKHIPPKSAHTFADAINLWNEAGGGYELCFGGLEGDTDCIEDLVLPPTYSNYSDMFRNCRNITSLDLSMWNVSGARYMQYMFYMCEHLIQLRLDGWDMNAVQDFSNMFGLCDHLNTLTLDNCSFPYAGEPWSIFDACRDLRVINMYGCDMQSVRFVLRELDASHIMDQVTLYLTPDSEEERAYMDLIAIIETEESIIEQGNWVKGLPDEKKWVNELIDQGIRRRANPLYFDLINDAVQNEISLYMTRLARSLSAKIEMTYTSISRGPFIFTRPDVDSYLERMEERYQDSLTLLPLWIRIAEFMPNTTQEFNESLQRIYEIPPSNQIDINKELKRLGFSNRWHVTIPALSRLMDRVTNNTRKGIEHLRYTTWERMKIVMLLLILFLFFGSMALHIAVNPGYEYVLIAFFAAAIIRVVFDLGKEKLKDKKERKALGKIIACMAAYVIIIVFIIRPIWNLFHF